MTIENNKIKDEWLNFGLSFLEISSISCEKMKKDKKSIKRLYISTIFNIKHSIEILLKFLVIYLSDDDIVKKLKIHDQKDIHKTLEEILKKKNIVKLIIKLNQSKKNDKDWIFNKYKSELDITSGEKVVLISTHLKILINKYYNCEFLKDKIGLDFNIEDKDNTGFKYPENNLSIRIDYSKVLERINDEDIISLEQDIDSLFNIFVILYILFVHLKNNKLI